MVYVHLINLFQEHRIVGVSRPLLHMQSRYYSTITFIVSPYPTGTETISLGHQYDARPACTSAQSDQAIYFWLLILINNPETIMDNSKIEDRLFHFRMFRVKSLISIITEFHYV